MLLSLQIVQPAVKKLLPSLRNTAKSQRALMSVSRWSWWNPRSNLFWKSTTTRQAPAVHICRLRLKLASYFHAGFELEKTMWNGSITPWSNCVWSNQASGPTIVQNKKRWTIRQFSRYYRWNNFIVFLPVELGGYFYPPFFVPEHICWAKRGVC